MTTPEQLLKALSAKTVLANGVKRLYRFTRFDAGRLSLMLSGGLVRMSNVKFFNDPYDCRPTFNMDAAASPELIDGMVAFFRTLVLPDKRDQFEKDVFSIKTDPEFRAHLFRRLERQAAQDTDEKWRLLCLAVTPFSQLLWSHYGDSHRGMCIEFDATVYPFSAALKVTYETDYPKLDFSGASPDTFAQVGLLTKAKCWAHEVEYRLISAEIDGSIYPRSHNDYLEFPREAIKAVILGLKAEPERHEEVRYLIRKFAPKTEFRMMVRDRTNYDLKVTANALDWPPMRRRHDEG